MLRWLTVRIVPSSKTKVMDWIRPSVHESAMSPTAIPEITAPEMSSGTYWPEAARLSRPTTSLNCIGSCTRPSIGTRPTIVVIAVDRPSVAFSGIVKYGISSGLVGADTPCGVGAPGMVSGRLAASEVRISAGSRSLPVPGAAR